MKQQRAPTRHGQIDIIMALQLVARNSEEANPIITAAIQAIKELRQAQKELQAEIDTLNDNIKLLETKLDTAGMDNARKVGR